MELRDLRVLVAVVDAGGVTRAAPRLHVVQSAVSQSIRRLERELDVTLLHRGPRGVQPTEAGAELVRYARELLELAARAEHAMTAHRAAAHGQLSLGLLPSLTPLVLSDLLRVMKSSPAAPVVTVQEAERGELLGAVRRHELDLALVWTAPDDPGVEHGASLPLGLIVAADHRFAGAGRVPMSRLRDESWVTFQRGGPGFGWVHDAAAAAGFQPRIAASVVTLAELKAFVQAGVGVTLLPPGVVAAERASGGLCAVALSEPIPRATLGWLVDPAAHRTAVATACDALRELAAGLAAGDPDYIGD